MLSDSRFTWLLVQSVHEKTLHGGFKLTLSNLRQSYWILRERNVVKSFVHRCLRCQRYRSSVRYQKLGNLTDFPVNPGRPISNTVTDYTGPFNIRCAPNRGNKSYKGYICISICLSTEAVHLELVSSYDCAAFTAAFRMFTARRGCVSILYSDQGTTRCESRIEKFV